MNKTITVDQAILRGHVMINYPALIILFGTISLTFYFGIEKDLPIWFFPLGFGVAFGIAWLWWSIMITKWRRWAFDKVRNVHELKRRAFREKLIWAQKSIFEKTEIRTTADQEKLDSLQYKFEKEDIFDDDLTIAKETVIYYSKGKNFVEMVIMLICFCTGIYLFINKKSYIVGSVLSIVGTYLAFKEFKQATNKKPQIILNDKGMKTISTNFYKWEEIEKEEVSSEYSGRHVHYYLDYMHPKGAEHLQIDDYDTDQRSLSKLLIIYRRRSKKR